MHRELREKGGAYGGGCSYSPLSGIIQFTTYRDPAGYTRTLEKFNESKNWATRIFTHCGERELLEAKLEVLKGLDRPLDASEEGTVAFYTRLSDDQRQYYRTAILNATLEDVESSAVRYLHSPSVTCVVGEKVIS